MLDLQRVPVQARELYCGLHSACASPRQRVLDRTRAHQPDELDHLTFAMRNQQSLIYDNDAPGTGLAAFKAAKRVPGLPDVNWCRLAHLSTGEQIHQR